jgi:putative endopeptidase
MGVKKRQTRKKDRIQLISTPTIHHVSDYLSSQHEVKENFYEWVNGNWLKETKIPEFENDFGISEEVERVIAKESKRILEDILKDDKTEKKESIFLKKLAESCLHSASQQRNVDFLKEVIQQLYCVRDVYDVVTHFAQLDSIRFPTYLQVNYTIDKDGILQYCLEPGVPSLPFYFYFSRDKLSKFREVLLELSKALGIEKYEMEKIIPTEKSLVLKSEEYYSDTKYFCRGSELVKKFPGIPWETFFQKRGILSWKKELFYYKSPRFIRFLGRMLKSIPLDTWKLLLMRAYTMASMKYLPPPFDELDHEFFGFGKKIKTPQFELLINIVYDYCNDLFSSIFWKEKGDESFVKEMNSFTHSILNATKHRLLDVEWLNKKTREKAVKKIESMRVEVVKPKHFPKFKVFNLDDKCLLKNIFLLGKYNGDLILERKGKQYNFWEEGIYRVNAYYFNENNEIMIPFGTMLKPFYDSNKSVGWNYGALGSIIGHEICHAFDEDGRFYDEKGQKKKWWSSHDNRMYNKKSKELIELFSKEKVLEKHVNGERTLSENIADLAGVGISLQALKEYIQKNKIKNYKDYYRDFFIAFAVSWRTKYTDEKLEMSLELDRHAPAFLRVNLIVSQFEEWYEAFELEKEKELIRIF